MKPNSLYFDNSALAFPFPPEFEKRFKKLLFSSWGNPSRGGHLFSRKSMELLFITRKKIAALFNHPDPSRVIFCQNTTAGLNIALKGILQPGDEVLISDFEHNSVIKPLFQLKDSRGISFKTLPLLKGKESIEKLLPPLLTPKTRLVLLNHSSNVFPRTLDLKKMGNLLKKRGIFLGIDGAQSVGKENINFQELELDFICFAGHKGLLSLPGAGVILLRKGLEINPLLTGGTGSHSDSPHPPEVYPDRLEAGTLNLPGILALNTALELRVEQGEYQKEIWQRDQFLRELGEKCASLEGVRIPLFKEALLKKSNPISLLSLTFDPQDPHMIANRLDREFSICVRSGLHCSPEAHKTMGTSQKGTLRISPSLFHREIDYQKFYKALKRLIQSTLLGNN